MNANSFATKLLLTGPHLKPSARTLQTPTQKREATRSLTSNEFPV